MGQTTEWLKSLAYLPPPLRDFHDQKDVFKAMHEIIDVQGHEYARSVDWVAGQCYVIDIFLWFMARRGYTLQRSRARVPFRDLDQDIRTARQARDAAASKALAEWLNQPTAKERT
jgi:hypothetical protein